MRLILSLLVVATAVGQSEVWSYLPTCAQPCAALGAAADSDCGSTDYACLCRSTTFNTISTCCVRSSCDTSDDNLVWEESQAFCSDFGVSITKLAESACSSTYSYSIPTTYPTNIASYLSFLTATASVTTTKTGTATATPITVTNTISISGGQATTVTITYTPTATGVAAGTTSTTSSSSDSSSGSGSSIGSSGNNDQKDTSGLSQGAKIGIGVGAGVGGLALIGGMIALIVYCCSRRRRGRRNTNAAATATTSSTAYTPVNMVGEDDKANAAGIPMYNELKPELDAQQEAEQQRLQQQIDQLQQRLQQQQQQHNPAAVPASAFPPGLAAPISPISDGSGRTSELPSESQGYYQHPDGGAQELGGVSPYQHQQYQYHHGVVTQAEMPGDPGHAVGQNQGNVRYELQ